MVEAVFLSVRAVLMCGDDGDVDHRVLFVRFICQGFEKTVPNAIRCPVREALVSVLPAADALRPIAPRRAGAEFPDHHLDEHPVVDLADLADPAQTARQQMFDSGKLVVAQSFHQNYNKVPYK